MTVEVKARATDQDDLLSLAAEPILIPDDETGLERAGVLLTKSPSVDQTAFGEASVAELSPIFQGDFSYNINAALWKTFNNNGTATTDAYRAAISTGAATNQSAILESRIPIKYNPGQGGLVRFTTIYDTPVVGSAQCHGIGDVSDGFFFAYSDTTFGVMRRHGGQREHRTLTITTGSADAENITVTLNGVAVLVAVTASSNTTTTVNEIAAHDFSGVGQGWEAAAHGSDVHFFSFSSEPLTGTYSVAGTSVVGTFARDIAGIIPTEDLIAQADWNADKMDGTGTSEMLLDQTLGNVYQVRYQWLGFGAVSFYIEDTETGSFVLVHRIKYANTATAPTINNPSLPLHMAVRNTTNTTDLIMYSASMGGFVEGRVNGGHAHHGVSVTKSYASAIERPILTIHNAETYQSVPNRSRIKFSLASIASDGTKSVIIRFKTNTVLTDAVFAAVSANTSVVDVDTSATAVSGGVEQFAVTLAKVDSELIPVQEISFFMNAGDFVTITAQSAGASIITASFNWEDLF